jgi:hypothetical protein
MRRIWLSALTTAAMAAAVLTAAGPAVAKGSDVTEEACVKSGGTITDVNGVRTCVISASGLSLGSKASNAPAKKKTNFLSAGLAKPHAAP